MAPPEDAQAAVEVRMRALLAGAPEGDVDPLYGWLRYQLGWARPDGSPDAARTAKGTRSRVCLVACAAAGGDPLDAVDAAAAIELVHEFSLIHDDIEDGDAMRRGRPALWTLVGVPQAINAGDALFALARLALSHGERATASVRLELVRRLDAACVRLAEGQHLDMGFESAPAIGAAQYEAMVARKTGALLGAAAALGAVAAQAGAAVADRLARWGELVGVAFQMRDDVLGLWGDPVATGKPIGNDLARRKQSLPIVLGRGEPDAAAAMRAIHEARAPTEAQVAAGLAALERAGVRARCQALAAARAEEALRLLDAIDLVPSHRRELLDLTQAAVDRER